MSKTEKFLSIGIDILKRMSERKESQFDCDLEHMDAKRLNTAIEKIGKKLQQKVATQTEECDKSYGTVRIEMNNEQNQGVPAQVKFFPLLSNESAKHYNRVNGKINMIREMTGEDGTLTRELPAGDYYIELSKGSEFEILTDELSVVAGQSIRRNYTIKRFIDLTVEHYYAGDLHHHSIYSSPVYGGDDDVKELPEEVCNSMRAMGLSFGALSDHHNVLNHEVWKQQQKNDFLPIISKEISTSNGHVLALGVEHDVIYHIPQPKERTDEFLRSEFRRITKEIKESDGLAQLNHPRDNSVSISWNPNFYDMIDIFDTIEIWNGSNPMYYGTTNEKAAILWRDLLEKGLYRPATTGSDTHNIRANDYHKLMDELVVLRDAIRNIKPEDELWKEYRNELNCFLAIYDHILPTMEKWAETNLTSGGVRTYVKLDGIPTKERVLHALKTGHSFLTDGPILIPEINGAGPGETAEVTSRKPMKISVRVLANRPLTTLSLYGNHGKQEIYELIENDASVHQNYYDYSTTLSKDWSIGDQWVFFVVADDCTNLAITNPIFFKEKN